MRTLYIDCGMGAAGDMLTAALLELLPEPEKFVEKLNTLGIHDVVFSAEKAVKCGITGTHITVKVHGEEEDEHLHEHHHHDDCHEHHHDHEHEHHHHNDEHDHDHKHHHHHTSMHDIEHIAEHLNVPAKVRADILAVYGLIAEAESHVHGKPVSEIHFHEVGTMDAVADITAACLLMNEISPDEVIASPVHVGSGSVHCAHGILPVPAPATAYILRDIPIYGGKIDGELCTPTGAALLRHFVTRFGDMPVMKTQAIGYGMGRKDFERANCVRVMLGETAGSTDEVAELSCNVDDMTAEDIAFAAERLMEAGAKDVFTVPCGMKKSRPGTLITVLCGKSEAERFARLILQYITTIGVRETAAKRYILDRREETVQTRFGEVRKKISSGCGVKREKYEYDDLARIAKEQDMSIEEVRRCIENG